MFFYKKYWLINKVQIIIRIVKSLFDSCCSKLEEHNTKNDEWNKRPIQSYKKYYKIIEIRTFCNPNTFHRKLSREG